MCKDMKSFSVIDRELTQGKLHFANNALTSVTVRRNVLTSLEAGNTKKYVKFENSLYVPDLRTNLISVGKVTDSGHSVIFDKNQAEIVDSGGNILLIYLCDFST